MIGSLSQNLIQKAARSIKAADLLLSRGDADFAASAKTGCLDPKYHRWLLAAFNKRLEGNYEFPGAVSPEDAATIIAQAREFLIAAEQFLASSAPPVL